MATTTGPTREIGQAVRAPVGVPSQGSLLVPNFLTEDNEYLRELRFPLSVREYNRMANDAQVNGLYLGATLPIRRYRWYIDPNDARDEVAQAVADDFGLPVLDGDPPNGRLRDRFSHDDHLRTALLAPCRYGFYPFEIVGRIDDQGRWRLAKLAPRPPVTVAQIFVEKTGDLDGLRQNIAAFEPRGNVLATVPPIIPVSQLAMYSWDREGGNWFGRSMLRSIYGNWLRKNDLLRISMEEQRRNGMGVPVAEQTVAGTDPKAVEEGQRVASAWRAGENAGASMPFGMRMRLLGVEGQVPDVMRKVEYEDGQMARSWLQMFAELGQTKSGNRALGEVFVEFFADGQETIAHWYALETTKQVIELWVELNYGPAEQTPKLAYQRNEDPELAVADLVSLIDAGAITVDPELEDVLRERYKLPDKPAGEAAQAQGSPPARIGEPAAARSGTTEVGRRVGRRPLFAAARASLQTPTLFRRELFPHEAQAGTDFEAMDAEWRSAVDDLLSEWEGVTQAEINDLVSQVKAAGSLSDLADVAAAPAGASVLSAAMRQVARDGLSAARAEAGAQGVSLPEPDLATVDDVLDQRAAAVDTLLAKSLSEAGGRKALMLAGGALENDQIAGGVRDHLEGLSTAYLADRLGGAVTSAQNYGRVAAFKEAEQSGQAGRYYASELLDESTCENCAEEDGTEFDSLADAEQAYPTGGYSECLGGDRCRGTVVAVFGEQE
jgi:Protein of unknown function (DUF935)